LTGSGAAASEAASRQRRYDFGLAVQQQRQVRGLTQEALAAQIGFDRKSINQLENGTTAMTLDRIWLVADALNVSIGELESRAVDIANERRRRQPQ
jgi:transcriptional regulator with XRE-family HTH domain